MADFGSGPILIVIGVVVTADFIITMFLLSKKSMNPYISTAPIKTHGEKQEEYT